MTCVDDNASRHLGVSDGAASEQKTLAAKASPGLIRMLPGMRREGQGVFSAGLLMWFLISIMELEAVNESNSFPCFSNHGSSWESQLYVQVNVTIAAGGLGDVGPSEEIVLSEESLISSH